MLIDHISLGVVDLERAMAFYDSVLEPLGGSRLLTRPGNAGYGTAGRPKPRFWIRLRGDAASPFQPEMHVAFQAPDRAAVDAFYARALRLGATDNGKPGLRPRYHENFYAAYVIDPDGHRLEAVHHRPPA